MVFKNIAGNTPIDDISKLIPGHITTQEELNEWEALNIIDATRKHLKKGNNTRITIEWLKRIHRDMFGSTWEWAGKFRKKDFNIGIPWYNITEQVKLLCDDIEHWEKQKNSPGIFERSVIIHHRLVKIHPFINGNGRHARLVSDVFLYSHNSNFPEWPEDDFVVETKLRKEYIKALKEADKGNYRELLKLTKRFKQNK